MKKVFILAAILGLGALTSCGSGTPSIPSSPTEFALTDSSVVVVNDGSPALRQVKVVRANGHSEPITLTVTGQPEGMNVTFAKNPIASSETVANLNFTAKGTLPKEYKLKLTGASPSATGSAIITVQVVTPQQVAIPDTTNASAYFSSSLGQVSISWTSVSKATGYRIDRKCGDADFNEITSSPVLAPVFTDKAPILGTTCSYRIRTVVASETSAGKIVDVSTVVEPSYVSAASNSTSVVVVWGTVVGATGYKIDRKIVGGNYAEIATLPSTGISYSDTGVTAGQSYVYRVRVVTGNYVSSGKESNPLLFTGKPGSTGPACCKVCTTGKPCGDTCIPVTKTCHKPGGCACNVVRPLVYQRIQDCGKLPAVGLDVNGKEVYLGTVDEWLKSVPNR